MSDLTERLAAFRDTHRFRGKGPLCVALHMTDLARTEGLPLRHDRLMTDQQGQVLGLGKSAVQRVLARHGITRVLAEEGGRTSRGSVGKMRQYVELLNTLHSEGMADLDRIEDWWVVQVLAHFAANPLAFRYDPSRSLRASVNDLFQQAVARERESDGAKYLGAVLQHLVGAKLDILMDGGVEHHGFSVADAVTARAGDFWISDVVFHVTTTVGEALLRKCETNLQSGLRPVVITMQSSISWADTKAGELGIGGRIDFLDAEQFIATNLHEWALRSGSERRIKIDELVNRYNKVVSEHETDPALRIKSGGPLR